MVNRRKLYDLIYDKADRLLKQYNPCGIRIKDGRLICNNKYMCKASGENLCCASCEYLGENGCTIKCLECKVGWCWQGYDCKHTFKKGELSYIIISETFIHQIDRLRKIMHKYELHGCRKSKKEVFEYYPILEEITV